MDDRARIAASAVDVFPFAASHRMERISTHIPIAGDARARPGASRGWRLNFQGVLSSRGSRIDHPSTRNPFRHRLRATLPPPKKTPRDIHERKTDFKSASSRTLQAGAALTITRPANAAYGDSANVFGSVSNPTGAFPMRCDAKPPACDFIHIQVVHSSIYICLYMTCFEKLASSSRREIRRLDFVSEFSPECIPL